MVSRVAGRNKVEPCGRFSPLPVGTEMEVATLTITLQPTRHHNLGGIQNFGCRHSRGFSVTRGKNSMGRLDHPIVTIT
jgi:hypothetical protein